MTQAATVSLRPSSIRIFLIDGSPTGLRLVDKSKWVGRGLVFPRSGYAAAKGRLEFSKAGVYVLRGPSEMTGGERVYIGEGDPVRERLDSHARQKDFWTQGVVFTSTNDNLNKAHVQYLEACLVERAKSAGRAELENGNVPTRSSLSEPDQAEMQVFLDEMLVCLPLLGFSAFESPAERVQTERLLHARTGDVVAHGYESEAGFVVRAGSTARVTETNTTPAFVSSIRKELLESGVFEVIGDKWRLTKDHLFNSPSTASSVMLGRNTNGRVEWKDGRGRTLKELQEAEAQAAEDVA